MNNAIAYTDIWEEMHRKPLVKRILNHENFILQPYHIKLLMEQPSKDIVPALLDYYFSDEYLDNYEFDEDANVQEIEHFIIEYIGKVADEEITDMVYDRFDKKFIYYTILDENNLFSAKHIRHYLDQGKNEKALQLLNIKARSYGERELLDLKDIYNRLMIQPLEKYDQDAQHTIGQLTNEIEALNHLLYS